MKEAFEEESDGRKNPVFLNQRMIRAVNAKFAAHADDMRNVLVGIAMDDTAKQSDRINAAKTVLDRGFGTPVSTTNLNVETNQGNMLDAEKMAGLPQEELQRTIETIRALVDQSNGGDMIDISPEQNESTDHAKGDEAE